MIGRPSDAAAGFDGSESPRASVEGVVVEALPDMMFWVELADGTLVLAHLSRRARLNLMRILPGDRVMLELSPFDPARGRISHRGR